MRLIDADRLVEEINNHALEKLSKGGSVLELVSYAEGLGAARKLVYNAETVDAVKHGHWTRYDRWRNGYAYICSECEEISSSNKDEHLDYCCHCGTKMDGEKRETYK